MFLILDRPESTEYFSQPSPNAGERLGHPATDLIDRLVLLTIPIVLGKGKRIFGNTSRQVALKLMKCEATPTGVIMATYERAGAVPTESL